MIRLLLSLAMAMMLAAPARALDIKEITSSGGIDAWLVETHDIPFTALEIRFKGGTSLDAPGKRGAVNLMAALLEEGAGDLDARAFARERDALATSFRLFPVGSELPSGAQLMVWLTFSAIIFTGAAQVALPVLTALLAANLALGLVSRAAPALNLFAIGFPATLLLVLLAMWAWLPAITEPLGALFNETIAVAKQGA